MIDPKLIDAAIQTAEACAAMTAAFGAPPGTLYLSTAAIAHLTHGTGGGGKLFEPTASDHRRIGEAAKEIGSRFGISAAEAERSIERALQTIRAGGGLLEPRDEWSAPSPPAK